VAEQVNNGTAPAETPEEAALLAGYAEKLKAMTPDVPRGKTASTKGAAAVAAREAAEAETPVTRRIKELNAKDSPLWKIGTLEGDKARDELRKLIAEGATQDEKDAYANLPVSQLRERFGVEGPSRLPSQLRGEWNQEREAEYLIAFHEQGVAPETVKSVYTWYLDRAMQNLGNFGEEDGAAFREFAKGKLPDDFVEKMIRYAAGEE